MDEQRCPAIGKALPSYATPRYDDRMNVDVFRRPESGNKLTYLIVPAGQAIPPEAENFDWELRQSSVHIDETATLVHPYEVERPRDQIAEKGYAITRLADQVKADGASV